jgi:hypothetical protein
VDHCPHFVRLRDEPRFIAVRARIARRAEDVVAALYES